MAEENKTIWPEGSSEIESVQDFEWLMAGKTGEPLRKIHKDKYKNYLSITGIEMKPVATGSLPLGPSGQERKMILQSAGVWTYGGNNFVNPVGEIMTLWWNGTAWSVADRTVLPVGKDGRDITDWEPKAYAFNSSAPNVSFLVFKDGIIWENNATTLSTDIPGISPKWKPETGVYLDVQGGAVSYNSIITNKKRELTSLTLNPGKYYDNTTGNFATGNAIFKAITKRVLKKGDSAEYELGGTTSSIVMAGIAIFDLSGVFVKTIFTLNSFGAKLIKGTYTATEDCQIGFSTNTATHSGSYVKVFIDNGDLFLDKSTGIRFNDFKNAVDNKVPYVSSEAEKQQYGNIGQYCTASGSLGTSSNHRSYKITIPSTGSNFLHHDFYSLNPSVPAIVKEVGGVFSVLTANITSTTPRRFVGNFLAENGASYYINPITLSQTMALVAGEKDKTIDFSKFITKDEAGALNIQRLFDKANVISDWSTELFSHASTNCPDTYNSGDIYCGYVSQNVSPVEDANISLCSMTWVNRLNLNKVTKLDVLKNGQTVGSFKAQTFGVSPYEPFMFNKDNTTLNYYMSATNENDSFGNRLVYREFNKKTKTLANNIKDCFIKYTHEGVNYTELFSIDNVKTMYNRLFGMTLSSWGKWFQTVNNFCFYNGYYYAFIGNSEMVSTNVRCFVVKTSDFINFEYVTVLHGTAPDYTECGYDIQGKFLYMKMRHPTHPIFRLDLDTLEWKTNTDLIQLFGNIDLSRPLLKNYKGRLIGLVNIVNYRYTGSDGYVSSRSGVGIYEIHPETLTPTKIRELTNMYGCHYTDANKDEFDSWYFTYSEDRRRLTTGLNGLNNRSDIGLLRFEDIVGF